MRATIKKISEGWDVFSPFFVDMNISTQGYFGKTNLIDIFNTKFVFYPTDHLFTSFMWPRVQGLSDQIGVFAADPFLVDELALMRPDVTRSTIAPQTLFTERVGDILPPSRREIDLLIPSTLVIRASQGRASIDQTLDIVCKDDNAKVVTRALYDALLPERRKHPLQVLDAVLEALTWPSLTTFRDENQDGFWTLLGILSEVDSVVRSARRLSIVNALLQNADRLRITVTSDPVPEYQHLTGIHWAGHQTLSEIHALYRQSKTVLNVHPTYPNILHERQANSLANGAVLITDFCPAAENLLEKGKHFLETDDKTSIMDFLHRADLDSIAAAGRDHVWKNFPMSAHAEAMISFLNTI